MKVNEKNKGRRSLVSNGTSRYEADSKLLITTHRSRSDLPYRRSCSEYSRSRSRRSCSSIGSRQQHSHKKTEKRKNIRETSNQINSMADATVQDLLNVVEKMNDKINENNQQLKDYDRLHCIEWK